MPALIALFPLSHVLLPGMPLPLHIFEPRYRELVADVGPTGSFGVVALRSGTEARSEFVADGAPDLEAVGTVAEILEVERQADGTADLLAVGSQRFTVTRLVTEGASYLRAEVEYLDEPDGPLSDVLESRARALIDVYDEMLVRLAGRGTGSELPEDANQLSYHLAARLPLPPGERQALLADGSTAERLTRLSGLLRREIALLQRTRSIAVSPTAVRLPTGIN